MILINLLPHRELARKRAKSNYNAMLLLAAVAGAIIAGIIYLGYETAIVEQQSRDAYLKAANARLDSEIKEITSLQSEISALKARQEAVESLQANRNLPVHLLNDAVSSLPAGLYLNSLKQDDQNVLLSGVAQSQERVSELLRNLANNSQWLINPELVEIQASQLALTPHDQRQVYNFTVRTVLPGSSSAASAAQRGRGAAKTKSGT